MAYLVSDQARTLLCSLGSLGVPAVALDSNERICAANQPFESLADGHEVNQALLSDILVQKAAAVLPLHAGHDPVYRIRIGEEEAWYRVDKLPAPGGSVAVLFDISKKSQELTNTARLASRFRSLSAEASIIFMAYYPDQDKILLMGSVENEENPALLERKAEDLLDNIHEDDVEMLYARITALTNEPGTDRVELRLRFDQDNWTSHCVQLRSGDQLPCGRYEIYGVATNVTEQAQARVEAASYARRLNIAINHAGGVVFEFDYDKREYIVLEKSDQVRPGTLRDSMGNNPLEMVHPDDLNAVIDMGRRAESGEKCAPIDVRWPAEDGGYSWVRLYYERLRDDDGNLSRGVGMLLDIDREKLQSIELERARSSAEKAAEAKSNFLASMSHEIRTPLNGVLGMAQALSSTELTHGQSTMVETIVDSGNTLMTLLNDVLDLSKIEAGKFDIVPTQGDIIHTLNKSVSLFKPLAEEKGLTLTFMAEPDLPRCLVFDSVRVGQCVTNLLSNAVKFTDKGSVRMDVSSRKLGGDVEITVAVSDTGIGMSEETLTKLFSPFTQADDSTSRKFGGTGLGLAITRKIAGLLGGEATAHSELGSGSRFSFSFKAEVREPAIEKKELIQVEVKDDSGKSAGSMSDRRILLVDDNPINRRVATLFMASAGPEIIEAENGEEALARLSAESFDLVLLDVHMPVMDGCETIRRIRASSETWHNIPVIALTADAMSGDRERYLSMGMSDYLSKPLDQRSLFAKLRQHLSAADGGMEVAATPKIVESSPDAASIAAGELEGLFDEMGAATTG